MSKTILTTILTTIIFCATVFADGNMGDGGRTGCDGTNPPPTCDCNVPNPPAACNNGGFASGNYQGRALENVDYVVAVQMVTRAVLTAF